MREESLQPYRFIIHALLLLGIPAICSAGSKEALVDAAPSTTTCYEASALPGVQSEYTDINNNGQIVGVVDRNGVVILSSSQSPVVIPSSYAASGSLQSQAIPSAINSRGDVVGTDYQNRDDLSGGSSTRGFVRLAGGQMRYIDSPSGTQLFLSSINDAGLLGGGVIDRVTDRFGISQTRVRGIVATFNSATQAYAISYPASTTNFQDTTSFFAFVPTGKNFAVSQNGNVFSLNSSQSEVLGRPQNAAPGAGFSLVGGMPSLGNFIAGSLSIYDYVFGTGMRFVPVLWRRDTSTNNPLLYVGASVPGFAQPPFSGESGKANDVNDSGVVVGELSSQINRRAFVYTSGSEAYSRDLNALLCDASVLNGGVLVSADHINNSGVIITTLMNSPTSGGMPSTYSRKMLLRPIVRNQAEIW